MQDKADLEVLLVFRVLLDYGVYQALLVLADLLDHLVQKETLETLVFQVWLADQAILVFQVPLVEQDLLVYQEGKENRL